MPIGFKRMVIARLGAALGFVCGLMGLVGTRTGQLLSLWPLGWFTGGTLLTVIALFILVDGAIASQKSR